MIPKYDLCTCARCEFIFRKSELVETQCPQCGFPGFYGARQVYGAKAHRFEKDANSLDRESDSQAGRGADKTNRRIEQAEKNGESIT